MSNESHEALLNDFLDAHRAVWSGRGDEAERHALCKEAEASRAALLTAMLAASPQPPVVEGWRDIASAPRTGATVLLGRFNALGNWRTMRGQWFSKAQINDEWDDTDCVEGWYETSVECEDAPNCWPTDPTHWMPLPAAPHPLAPGETKREDGK